MGKKRTTASNAGAAGVQLDDDGVSLRLYHLEGGKVTVELTERRPPGPLITQTVNFGDRAALERWIDAERFALERPLLYAALLRKLDEIWRG
jgi:hypothetical protein